ncbi:MAG: 3'-5' exonuclease [Elusimicrobiales bacterium]|nr:3'-5' exonuclease [Elusimicrobiales bacterium]
MKKCIKMNKNTLIDDVRFIIVDVETTGLNPLKDRICEIAFIEIKGLKENARFSSLINPTISIPPSVTSIHGISDDDVKEAPYFFEISNKLIETFYDSVIVGHNIKFDFDFIDNELRRIGLKMPEIYMIDTLILSKKFLTNTINNKLKNVAMSINLYSDNWHRALNDVEITKDIFIYFITMFIKEKNLKTLNDLIEISK